MFIFLKKVILIGIGLFIFLSGYAQQSTTVTLTNHKGKKILFKVKTKKIEWVNGKINLSLLSTDGKLLQLNNISESFLKDTTFRNSNISSVLITDSATFYSIKRISPLVEIVCSESKVGAEIAIIAQGSLFYKKSTYKYQINFYGNLPEKRFNTTYKKKIQQ